MRIHTTLTLPWQILRFNAMVLQKSEQVWQSWNHSKAKQRQNQHHPKEVRRLPGSSVWPADHRSWNRRLGKIQLSSQSAPTLRDMIRLPPASHLKLYSRVRGREATAPSPPLRWAPGRSQKLQPRPDRTTLPQQEHRGLRRHRARSCGTQRDCVRLTSPDCCWFPHEQTLSLNHCIGN